jgi:hypothetical protein
MAKPVPGTGGRVMEFDLTEPTPEQLKEREEIQKASKRLDDFLKAPQRVVIVSSPTMEGTGERITTAQWIAAEAKRLKRSDEIPANIGKTDFAKLLADNMRTAAKTNESIRAITRQSLMNRLSDWGLWPISAIE